MTKTHYNTKQRTFKHLTVEKRAQIELLLKQGKKNTEIAKELGISRSTLYEELKRGTVEQQDTNLKSYYRYFAEVGQRVYETRRKDSKKPYKLAKASKFLSYAKEQIVNLSHFKS